METIVVKWCPCCGQWSKVRDMPRTDYPDDRSPLARTVLLDANLEAKRIANLKANGYRDPPVTTSNDSK